MKTIHARNVNEALVLGIQALAESGKAYPSRNGDMIEYPGPVTTTYLRPTERVLFEPLRDANPFLHFFESLWMLAGRDDVAYLTQFVKRFKEFSDDGKTFNGAYGHRWRSWFQGRTPGRPVRSGHAGILHASAHCRRCNLSGPS